MNITVNPQPETVTNNYITPTPINHVQLLMSKSKKNSVKCAECDKVYKEAHLYCVRFKSTDGITRWESKYTVGCTHVEWDGEEWCSNCVTIADQKILCSRCGKLDWGTPNNTDNPLKYMWVDGSESSI